MYCSMEELTDALCRVATAVTGPRNIIGSCFSGLTSTVSGHMYSIGPGRTDRLLLCCGGEHFLFVAFDGNNSDVVVVGFGNGTNIRPASICDCGSRYLQMVKMQ